MHHQRKFKKVRCNNVGSATWVSALCACVMCRTVMKYKPFGADMQQTVVILSYGLMPYAFEL